MFQTMRSFPKRFCTFDLDPEQPHEYTWGFHHEDWTRASVVYSQHKRRRFAKMSDEFKTTRQNSNAPSWLCPIRRTQTQR
ncbi:hypothetical protein B0J15DRAFT_491341 [Fusarium solani]|uniref:Uncharacterized protein n=1 Tax=Fusarium solani TaxID=169388 RepID=A0A9P9HLR5_FUSSL|nr:uncharacterized protein B0J15DRAFT_491341 [Fusarium solani]KAH7259895.1 hypothetical protein B0J15DRAFT_491341 [Fusarium solani]